MSFFPPIDLPLQIFVYLQFESTAALEDRFKGTLKPFIITCVFL